MWTEASRGRIATVERKTKRYPSDLTDEEWERIAPLMPAPGRRGRPREVDFREVINAVALSGPLRLRMPAETQRTQAKSSCIVTKCDSQTFSRLSSVDWSIPKTSAIS